jgi:hypothetical protein
VESDDLDALNSALRLGARLRELPAGAVVLVRSLTDDDCYQGTVMRQIPRRRSKQPIWQVSAVFSMRMGGTRNVTTRSILEVLSLPDNCAPLSLIGDV